MNLSDLKLKSPQEIIEMAESMGLEDISRKRKQDLIFAITKEMMKNGEEINGEGTLELLPDGYGFLRSEINSYQASPDDIYVSPNLIRRCNLRTILFIPHPYSKWLHLHTELFISHTIGKWLNYTS